MNATEVFEKGEEVALKDLERLFSKPTLSPAEYESAKNAVCLIKAMHGLVGFDGIDDGDAYSQSEKSNRVGYSRANWPMNGGPYREPYREYAITSYADPRAQGGSSRMRGGYSNHSVQDRMVHVLEGMIDSASSDYERSMIERYIHMIRQDEMR